MIDLQIFADRPVEACLVFDGATALRTRMPIGVDRLHIALGIDETIRHLQELKEYVTDFVGAPVDRLTVFRRPGLAPEATEYVEAAAFAVGFDNFETVSLGNLAHVLIPARRSKALLLVHASRERLSGVALTPDVHGKLVVVREAAVEINAATIRDSIIRVLDRGNPAHVVRSASTIDGLVERFWGPGDPDSFIDAHEWRASGWTNISLRDADAREVSKVIANALQELLNGTFKAATNHDVIVIGEARARVSVLLRELGAHVVAAPIGSILDAMVLHARIGRSQPSLRYAEAAGLEARLLFDPRTDLGMSSLAVRRDNAAVRVQVQPGHEHRLEHIPAKWHRAGFDVEIIVSGKPERVRLFKDHVGMDVRMFSVRIASRWAAGARLFTRITIPELGASALIVAQVGHEMLVAHYAVRNAD